VGQGGESGIRTVMTWLREQEMSWYREGMHALVSRWHKAVDVDGDYVEITHV
jgi:23S rRNA maturation mini-RNase III